ncbi:prolipoprotein diacylglyceryl transferase [Cardinium endosymbiont of Oedothorax gibbosus]|uniref:prolipoprotein diacylglyceryl transferase n=1 Tax=Cardinium endosymbiont of Oedothorax gibbosus TaxID=931101 RepID=UPI002025AD5C|nr:prolipoprotein diacylglyceryl transferase [Cardinium endosymbiont of Oedothorax gibbosus]CAH2560073.1 Phosphatidylglycerol--prolipoprotein diacylglyceryl transferase [Cardinium endosymbiont of Oedothorax gibbosus]
MPSIIWDVSPELFTKGFLNIRWYNLLFAAGVLGGLPIWYHMFAKAGKTREEADQIKDYIVLSVLLGARLGHVIFYEWNYYKDHLLEIFLPVIFSPNFKITGFGGLASHGAGIGMVLAVFLYVKRIIISFFPPHIRFKNRRSPGEFLWIIDHLSILFPLGAALIRIGNFMNSEVIGKPTRASYGVIFVRDLHENLCKKYASTIDNLVIRKASTVHTLPIKVHYPSTELAIAFNKNITDEKKIKNFLEQSLKNQLVQETYFSISPKIYEIYGTPLSYTLQKQNGGYQARVYTWGIPRHPAQLYESFSYFLIFIMLFLWWYKKGETIAPGRIFGTLIVTAACMRFFCECYKENQVAFENNMWLNMGQLLSLPWAIVGLFLILRRSAKTEPKTI